MVTLKFGIAFIFAIILLVLRQDIWLVIAVLSLIVALLFKIPIDVVLQAFREGILGRSTVRLILAVWLIISFGEVLYRSGYLTRFVSSVEGIFRDQRLAFIMPSAIIGLLPMPSGAMLSAPLAEEIGKKLNVSREELTFFNYWFRHIWEYSWPLYPGLILASAITGVPVWKIGLRQVPMVLVAVLIGIFLLMRRIPSVREVGEISVWKILDFVVVLWPIYVIVTLVMILRLDLIYGLSAVFLLVVLIYRASLRDVLASLKKGFSWKIFLILVSVMVFKSELEVSGVMEHLPGEMVRWGFSPVVPLVLIPFLVGFLTGVNSAYIGVGFPVLMGILGENLDMIFIAYVSGFMGVLLSPAHLCLAVTKTYFRADTAKLYRMLFPSVLALYSLFWLYMWIFRL